MKKKAIIAFLISIVLFSAGIVQAAGEFQFGLAFTPLLPQGEFHDALGKTAWGGEFSFAWRPSRSPVLIGTSLGFGIYDSDRWEAWLGLTDPDVLVDVRTTNSILVWDIFVRLQPERGFLRPYLDLFGGLHLMSSDTRIEEGDSDDDVSGSLSVNVASDAAFAFGAGAGLMFPIVKFVHRDGRTAAGLEMDLGVRYSRGGPAEYLRETDEPGIYDFLKSRTDLLVLKAGLTFSF